MPIAAPVATALIGLGGSFLSGFFGGKGKKQEQERQISGQKELMKYEDELRRKRAAEFKPSSKYETYGNLGDFDQVLKTYLANLLGQWGGMGKDKKGLGNFDPAQLYKAFSGMTALDRSPGPTNPQGEDVKRTYASAGYRKKKGESEMPDFDIPMGSYVP